MVGDGWPPELIIEAGQDGVLCPLYYLDGGAFPVMEFLDVALHEFPRPCDVSAAWSVRPPAPNF